jgi:AcrR family transcriptional regulator
MPAAAMSSTHRTVMRPQRADGLARRAQILEIAGRVYAEKGFARTTSKEICARARVNMAAVNYHFGDKSKLYDEVLVEAHRHIVSLDVLESVYSSEGDAIDKLRQIVAGVLKRATDPAAPWGVRVLVREIMSWSPHPRAALERALLPKAGVLRRLVATALELPESHAAVQCCMPLVLSPAMMLVIAPAYLRRTLLPALDQDSDTLIDNLTIYMRAGLQAVRRKHMSRILVDAAAPRSRRPRPRPGSG